MKKAVTIKENYEFRRMYQSGKSEVSPFLVVYVRKNREGRSRSGFTASTKLGGAVVRNRAKRRLRALYWEMLPATKKGFDLLLVARGRTLTAPYGMLLKEYTKALKKLGVFLEETP